MSDPTNLGASKIGGEIETKKLLKIAPHLGEEFKATPLPAARHQERLPAARHQERTIECNFPKTQFSSDTSFGADMGITPSAFDAQNWK